MSKRGRFVAIAAIAILAVGAVGCSSTPSTLLDKVTKAGKLVVSTDPKYPPQSSQKSDGTYEGFDIDVGTEIAKRLGRDDRVHHPRLERRSRPARWGGRWDFSVGSMTITIDRARRSSTSASRTTTRRPRWPPARASGITTLDGLAGKTICAGEGTTYDDWLKGTLDFGTAVTPRPRRPPASRRPR